MSHDHWHGGAIAALWTIALSASSQAQQAMTADKLVGAWQLISFTATTGDQVSYPLGEHPGGYIGFSPSRFWIMLIDSTRKGVKNRRRASWPTWKNLLRYRTPAWPTAGLRQAVAAIGVNALPRRPQYPNKPPPQLAAVASETGHGTKSLRDSPLRGALAATSLRSTHSAPSKATLTRSLTWIEKSNGT
jgi:Lipocalin-like domain